MSSTYPLHKAGVLGCTVQLAETACEHLESSTAQELLSNLGEAAAIFWNMQDTCNGLVAADEMDDIGHFSTRRQCHAV